MKERPPAPLDDWEINAELWYAYSMNWAGQRASAFMALRNLIRRYEEEETSH